jgi:hypothetical protein
MQQVRLPQKLAVIRSSLENVVVIAMNSETPHQAEESNRISSDTLHPAVYRAMVGLAAWVVLAAWGFFADRGYIFLALSVVTWLVTVAVVLSAIIARIGRRDPRRGQANLPFRDWAHGNFGLWEGRIKGSVAATEIFVPLLAVAIAMTLFAIVRDVVVS